MLHRIGDEFPSSGGGGRGTDGDWFHYCRNDGINGATMN